jgi:hypothetical protein
MKFEDMPPMLQEIIREKLSFYWDWTINPPKFEADEFIKFEWYWNKDRIFFYLNNKQIDFFPISWVNFEIIKSKKEGKIKIKWGDLICPKPWPEDIEWIEEE